MSKYNFSPAERYAVYTVHNEKCYLCKEPLDLQSMHVDHIIPETLLDTPDKLSSILQKFGLDKDFDINSYHNWMPSCVKCNLDKSSSVFKPTPIIQIVLQKAKNKSTKAQNLEDKTIAKRSITRAINTLERAKEKNELDQDMIASIEPLIEYHKEVRNHDLKNEPIRLTPFYEVLSDSDGIKTIRGRYGIGGRPSDKNAHGSFDCPNCGPLGAWNGARCVVCGHLEG